MARKRSATDFDHETPKAETTVEGITIRKEQLETLGFKLFSKFTENETLRRSKEIEWLEDLRLLNGIYDPKVLQDIGDRRSRAYPKIAASKKKSIEAKLHDICFPDVGKAWSIDPTPEPEVSQEDVKAVFLQLVQEETRKWEAQAQQLANQNGGSLPPDFPQEPPQPTPEKVISAIKALARKKSEAMEGEMDDQLVEMKYSELMKKAMDSGLAMGTGIIKGPLARSIEEKKWRMGDDGVYYLHRRAKHIPHLGFVRIWDWYPDATVSEREQCEGFFERHVMTKHDVRKLSKRKDFAPWARFIDEYLAANPDGDCIFKHWELELQQIDSKDGGEVKKGKKYEVLEYWGYVDARELEECGVQLKENQKNIELQVNIWILGKTVIKAVLNPTAKEEQPYHVFYLEKDETSIFGKGLARIMRDMQINLGAATRMLLDNGAICAGPQIEVNVDLIDEDEDYESIFPFKIWVRKGMNAEAQSPAVRVFNIDSHLDEYLKIIDLFLRFADLETAIPTNALIEPQATNNETAQGSSIKYGTVNITIKDIAKLFDTFTSGILEGIYAWNMEFNEREDIKGDYEVHAKGLSSLIAKEVRANVLQNASTTIVQQYRDWIKERDFLVEMWKAMDLPLEIIRTVEEHAEYVEQTTDPRLMELQVEQLEATVKELKAKALNYLSQAKKKNVEAVDTAVNIGKEEKKPAPKANPAKKKAA
jgi:hypothetical protein